VRNGSLRWLALSALIIARICEQMVCRYNFADVSSKQCRSSTDCSALRWPTTQARLQLPAMPGGLQSAGSLFCHCVPVVSGMLGGLAPRGCPRDKIMSRWALGADSWCALGNLYDRIVHAACGRFLFLVHWQQAGFSLDSISR